MGKIPEKDGLRVASDNRTFTKDGQPFFWLGDTLWSAFTSMTERELDSYLTLRRQQGFNVLQINILPQWDRCWVPAPYMPWPLKDDGNFDFSGALNQDYFDHAAAVCKQITEKGFVPALVVLWSNYVPDTWASGLNGGNIMPKDCIIPYCQKVSKTFAPFHPVYVVSGDTDLESSETVEYYSIALDEMRRLCPDSLLTMHIKGRYTNLPDSLPEKLDFYLYQSGHNAGYPEKCYTMPNEMLSKYPQKPILNAEPCYEQMGYSGSLYGRFSTRDVRRAAWMSVLSGACAGITYGAHGIWNWQTMGMPVNPNGGEGFDTAKPWTEALQFSGAWDYGYLKQLLENLSITALVPDDRIANRVRGLKTTVLPDGTKKTERVFTPNAEIRMASVPDGRISLIYAPSNTKILVKGDWTDAKITAVDLQTRRIACPEVHYENEVTAVAMCPFAEDVLLVLDRRNA